MDKYYTPSIEEIHIGLNCQFTTCGGALRCEITDDIYTGELDIVQIQDLFYFYSRGVMDVEEMIRVKYLSKEDIESLGWKLHHEELKQYSCWCIFKSKDYELYVQLNNKYTPRHLSFKARGHCYWRGNFQIEIKNKLELKKLMSQLGIKNNFV